MGPSLAEIKASMQESAREKVIVGWPDGGSVASLFCQSMLALSAFELTAPSDRYALDGFSSRSGLYVQENRNGIVKALLDSDADWLLQLDGDESFQPYLLRQLMEIADAATRPIVVGLYTNVSVVDSDQGSIQIVNCIYEEAENGQYRPVEPPSDLAPFRVAAAGTGVMLTHRSVFEAMEYPWFWLEMFENEDGTRQLMNEDLAFCRSATVERGYPIWCVPLAEVTHWKTLPLVPSTTRTFLNEADQVFSSMRKPKKRRKAKR